MTPINLPINFEPRVGIGVSGDASGGIAIAWAMVGVGGADDPGLGDSTSHILDKCLAVTLGHFMISFLPMGLGRNKLSNCMGQCGLRVDMEDRIRVLPVSRPPVR